MNKKMSSAQRRMFVEEAARSLAQQREIEAADSISFEEYLRRYFAQSLDRRESVLR
jgi:glutamate--cysteine ligase